MNLNGKYFNDFFLYKNIIIFVVLFYIAKKISRNLYFLFCTFSTTATRFILLICIKALALFCTASIFDRYFKKYRNFFYTFYTYYTLYIIYIFILICYAVNLFSIHIFLWPHNSKKKNWLNFLMQESVFYKSFKNTKLLAWSKNCIEKWM